MLTGLLPLVNRHTRLLILGSFPSASSLASQQYYAHPRNQFWPLVYKIYGDLPMNTGADSYRINSKWLLGKGVGLWDVYAACEREGSLDQHILQPVENDFSALLQVSPMLQAVAHNGAKSFKLAPHVKAALAPQELTFFSLPSTSPAHAAMPFEAKLQAWRAAFVAAGLR